MVGPAVGVGLHCHGDPGGGEGVGEPEGHQQTVLGPVLFPAHRDAGRGEQVAVIKADLTFLHLHLGLGKGGGHLAEKRLIQGQLNGFPLEVEQHIRKTMFRVFHKTPLLVCFQYTPEGEKAQDTGVDTRNYNKNECDGSPPTERKKKEWARKSGIYASVICSCVWV